MLQLSELMVFISWILDNTSRFPKCIHHVHITLLKPESVQVYNTSWMSPFRVYPITEWQLLYLPPLPLPTDLNDTLPAARHHGRHGGLCIIYY